MSRVLPLLLLAVALSAAPAEPPSPEEVAALLLSPDGAFRRQALAILTEGVEERMAGDVLREIAKRGHDLHGWLADLARRARDADGPALLAIERIRDALIGGGDLNVGLDLYAVGVVPELAEALLGEARGVRVGESPEGWKRVWRRLLEDPASEVLGWVALSGRDRLPALSRFERQVSYVSAFDVDARGVATPRVETLKVGASAQWTPTLSADRREVTLDLDLAVSDLARPVRTREMVLGATRGRVQEPEVSGATCRRTITLPSGGYALVGLPGPKGVTILLFQAVAGAPRCEPPPAREKKPGEAVEIR